MLREDGFLVVTGGASGIGRRIVEQALAGSQRVRCAVLDLGRPGPDAAGVDEERLLHLSCDVSDADAVEAAMATVEDRGPIRHLVTCAGTHLFRPALELAPADWRAMLAVHLDGTLFAAQSAGRRMRAAGGGTMVFFSSAIAPFGHPGRVGYAVGKAGVEAMTRTLAVELAPEGIRVNAVAPGYIDTAFVKAARASGAFDLPAVLEEHAMGRLGDPSEVADAVLYLLGSKSSYVTGEVLRVDGGFAVTKMPFGARPQT